MSHEGTFKKKAECFVFIGIFLGLLGCATVKDRISEVKPGMAQNQVEEILGKPVDRSFRGSQEKWVYEGVTEGQKKLVVFEEGKVVEFLTTDNAVLTLHEGTDQGRQGQIDRKEFCTKSNTYGRFPESGGCNMYGCWPKGGYCNSFGCSSMGRCTVYSCPKKIESYRCVD